MDEHSKPFRRHCMFIKTSASQFVAKTTTQLNEQGRQDHLVIILTNRMGTTFTNVGLFQLKSSIQANKEARAALSEVKGYTWRAVCRAVTTTV